MIFKLIFLIFLIGLLTVGFSALKIIHLFREGIRQFRQQAYTDSHQRQHHKSAGNRNQTVVDHRNSAEANKKIFTKEEGEYVDFEEETT